MEYYTINLSVQDIEQNKRLEEFMEKLLSVIKSMSKYEHIQPTRKYINLWYETYGIKHKGLIELYFKSKTKELK